MKNKRRVKSSGMIGETREKRVEYHLFKSRNNLAILSVYRPERSLAENRARTEELKQWLLSKRYGFIPIVGFWKEGEADPIEKEATFMIPNISYQEAMKIGKDNDQTSIIFKQFVRKYNAIKIAIVNTSDNYGYIDLAFDGTKVELNIKQAKIVLDAFKKQQETGKIDTSISYSGASMPRGMHRIGHEKPFTLTPLSREEHPEDYENNFESEDDDVMESLKARRIRRRR